MSKLDSISAFCNRLGETLAGIIKIALLSRCVRTTHRDDGAIVVLGNGPSLNQTLAESADFLRSHKKLAVNFAATTPQFFDLRPEYYVLADPHFFNSDAPNVRTLWQNLARADWQMVLYVPRSVRRLPFGCNNPNIIVERYNQTPVEGFRAFRHAAYRARLGMPRPRNVLIPSLMLAIAAGFKEIYIAGADHSWMKTIAVDDDNNVVSVQPHFYTDSQGEQQRIRTEYLNYPLHKIIHSFYIAFRSYFIIRDYADARGVTIWNITPGSFIDAFPRRKV